MEKEKIIEKITFKVKQMSVYVYGRDYFLGDLVDARYLDNQLKPKVAAVVLEQEKMGTERVDVICWVG